MKRLFVILLCLPLLFNNTNPASAAGLTIDSTIEVTPEITGVGQIWKGDIPTSVSFPDDSYSEKLDFPISGVLPISVLADRATGVEVEFEIWSDLGVKLASQTIYSFSWNPVGPKTMVSMYLTKNDGIYGKHTMLITTSYTTSTTGLLSRYLKDEKRIPIEIKKILPKRIPGFPKDQKGMWQGTILKYSFSAPESNPEILYYEVGLADSVTGMANSYYEPTVLKRITQTSFELTPVEFLKTLSLKNDSVIVKVRAVNSVGNSSWSGGIYSPVKEILDAISLLPPPADISCQYSGTDNGVKFTASVSYSNAQNAKGVLSSYDWEYSTLSSKELPPENSNSYNVFTVYKNSNENAVTIPLKDILSLTKGELNTSVLVYSYPRNKYGNSGIRGKGCYFSVADLSRYINVTFPAAVKLATEKAAADLRAKQEADDKAAADLRAKQEADDKAAAELKAKQEAEAKAAADLLAKQKAAAAKASASKKTTITCIKGKTVKKVTAAKPVCPKGYKKK